MLGKKSSPLVKICCIGLACIKARSTLAEQSVLKGVYVLKEKVIAW